jgi:hypothetical protein
MMHRLDRAVQVVLATNLPAGQGPR